MKLFFSLIVSCIFLVSHMYLTIGTHYCGGEVVESTLLLDRTHIGCELMDIGNFCNVSKISNENNVSLDQPPCCENTYQTLQIDSEYIKDAMQTNCNVEFAFVYLFSIQHANVFAKSTFKGFTNYISPPFENDIQVLFQTFLI